MIVNYQNITSRPAEFKLVHLKTNNDVWSMTQSLCDFNFSQTESIIVFN